MHDHRNVDRAGRHVGHRRGWPAGRACHPAEPQQKQSGNGAEGLNVFCAGTGLGLALTTTFRMQALALAHELRHRGLWCDSMNGG
jgi:hypothetical protein